jgi:Na+/proline symporter
MWSTCSNTVSVILTVFILYEYSKTSKINSLYENQDHRFNSFVLRMLFHVFYLMFILLHLQVTSELKHNYK